jgi:hypothetical protein
MNNGLFDRDVSLQGLFLSPYKYLDMKVMCKHFVILRKKIEACELATHPGNQISCRRLFVIFPVQIPR